MKVTCALIVDHDKVLVALRPRNKSLGGKWEFPGGKIEKGETAEMCLIREIQEELGCEITIKSSLTPIVHDYSEFSIELIPFVCSIINGEPQPLEHDAIKWCKFTNLEKIDLADADKPILIEFIENR